MKTIKLQKRTKPKSRFGLDNNGNIVHGVDTENGTKWDKTPLKPEQIKQLQV